MNWIKVGKFLLGCLLGLLTLWLVTGLHNSQCMASLVYDAGACCVKGHSRGQVRDCFISRGYTIRHFGSNADMVDPGLFLAWPDKHFFIHIEYRNGIYQKYNMDALVNSL
jgi:hypothetical protein